MLEDPAYGTHLVPLAECLANTKGPVLEVGMGDWSTPFVHRYCTVAKRTLVSVDDSPEWAYRFDFATGDRRLVSYDEFLPQAAKRHWSVVLIDHWPEARRATDALLFRRNSEYVLIHDARKILRHFAGGRPPEGWQFMVQHDTIILHTPGLA